MEKTSLLTPKKKRLRRKPMSAANKIIFMLATGNVKGFAEAFSRVRVLKPQQAAFIASHFVKNDLRFISREFYFEFSRSKKGQPSNWLEAHNRGELVAYELYMARELDSKAKLKTVVRDLHNSWDHVNLPKSWSLLNLPKAKSADTLEREYRAYKRRARDLKSSGLEKKATSKV